MLLLAFSNWVKRMCGICGVMGHSINDVQLLAITRRMSDSLIHRGPDGSGMFNSQPISLGHRRLAIIDLVTGDQPMISSDKRYAITFNGEIFNYIELREELKALGRKFRTTSDTEVLLQAFEQWGSSCTSRLNGMWAFAIWDEREKKLFLSRDRFGIKPLYYSLKDGMFIFASEPKAILATGAVSKKVNRRMIYDYLAFTVTDHTSETFFEEITQLPPGHSMVIDASLSPKIEKFWQIPPLPQISQKNEETLIEEFRNLFSDAVRIRLRSDVPVGSCLSGGIDSTSIVCTAQNMLKDANGKVQKMETFSAIFEEASIDESRFIKETERKIETRSHYVTPDNVDILIDLENIIRSQDEPVVSPSVIAQGVVMRLSHENNVKVLLDGQGADETLGGYSRFISSRAADLFKEGMIQDALRILTGTRTSLVERFSTMMLFLSMASKGCVSGISEHLLTFFMHFISTDSIAAMHKDLRAEGAGRTFDRYQKHSPYLYSSLRFSTESRLPELLRYEDRNSMRYSIETRLPYLDYRLVMFEFSLPDSLKMNGIWTKRILHDAMIGIIPEMIRKRRDKLGFDVPDHDWVGYLLRNGGLKLLSESPRVVSHRIFDQKFVSGFVNAFPKHKDWKFAWRLLNLEIWLRTVIEGESNVISGKSGQ